MYMLSYTVKEIKISCPKTILKDLASGREIIRE